MKVEQKKEFAPITITLETEEEAIKMWAALNTSHRQQIESLEGTGADYIAPSSLLWETYNNIFPLEKLYRK
jgi:hypothetical protein